MFDAYEVAIMLRLKDHFSGAMGIVTRRLIEGNKHADQLQKRLEGIGKIFTAGLVTTGAGYGMAMLLKASANEAIRYEQQLNRLKALNLDARFGVGTTDSLENQAKLIAKNTKGTTYTDALNLITETQAITGNVEHTEKLAPLLGKLRFGLETYMSSNGKGEGHGADAEKQFQDIVKVMEMRGLMRNFTDEKMEKMADLFAKSFIASGGMVKPSDFLAMMKTGGTAAKSVGDDFMFALGHIMQEKGGSRSGTALMSEYQNLVAGRMPQQIAETLKGLGLLQPNAIHYGKTGHITKVDAGGMVDSPLLQSRPDLYLQKYILPALAKSGVDMGDQNSVLMKLNGLSGQRTASDFLAQMYLEHEQISNYVEQSKNSMGLIPLYDQSGKSTTGQVSDAKAKVINLEKDFGEASLPVLKIAYENLIPIVKDLGAWMERHPDDLKTLVGAIAGLSVAALVSGPLMVIGSGIGLLSTGLALMSGPLGAVSLAMGFREIGGASGLASLAANLGSVGGQLKLLGSAGLVVGSGWVGWQLGTIINDIINKFPALADAIGWFYTKMVAHFDVFHLTDAQDSLDRLAKRKEAAAEEENARQVNRYNSFVKGRADNSNMMVQTSINIDGRKFMETVTPYIANPLGASNFGFGSDLGLAMPMPGNNK